MKAWKISTASVFVAALIVPTVLGFTPVSFETPVGAVCLQPQEAEARARNTANNRLRSLNVPTSGANFTQRFSPTRHNYMINLHEDRQRVSLEPRRDNTRQSVRHRIDVRRENGTWNNGNWTRWRTGSNANNRINVDVNRGQERRVRIAVRDRAGNVRTYTVNVGRASANTWGATLRTNTGSFNRSFARNITNYTLTIPHNRASANVTMSSERNRSAIRTRVGNGAWSNASFGQRSRTVNVPENGERVVQFRIRGPFSWAAPSPTRDRIYTVTVRRAGPPANVNAAATPQFTFRGTGWGHGVGMSQNGAMQKAREGRSSNQILQHYFTGVSINNHGGRVPDDTNNTAANRMRINLDAARGNRTQWRIGPQNGTASATITIGNRTFNGTNAPYTFTVRNGNIRMTDRNGATNDFGTSIRITGSGGLTTVLGQSGPPLPSVPHSNIRYRGTLELTVVSGRLRLVNEVTMRHYLYGVVPREIPSGNNAIQQAIRAQAVAARSFSHAHRNNTTGVSSTVSFQVYAGHSRFASEANWRNGSPVTAHEHANSNAAVDATNRQVVVHGGNIVRAFYSACNGNHTANSEDVWVARLGHLRGVRDDFCGRSNHAGHNWTVVMNGLEVANALRSRGASVPSGAGSTVYVTRLESSRVTGGWVRTLTVHWSNGTRTTIGNADNVRIRLGLRSANFSINTGQPVAAAAPIATAAPISGVEAFEGIAPLSSGELAIAIDELIEGNFSPIYLQQEMRNYMECEPGDELGTGCNLPPMREEDFAGENTAE